MKIHLEGMGLLGSLTAWQLDRYKVPFTWNDNDSPHTAWKASTGACYPSGSEGSLGMECYNAWAELVQQTSSAAKIYPSASKIYPARCFSEAPYWVDRVNKTLPHGVQASVLQELPTLRRLDLPSYHVNAQELVRKTRKNFAFRRRDTADTGADVTITAHGFSSRMQRVLWGWTRLVRLEYDVSVFGERPCFYLRKNRFQFAYCYPVPGTKWWYAGSNLITQHQPAHLDMEGKYAGWKQRFLELTGGQVSIVEEGAYIEGWRPALEGGLSANEGHAKGEEGRPKMLLWKPEQRRLLFPVMTSNGFRHYPEVWKQLSEFLRIK